MGRPLTRLIICLAILSLPLLVFHRALFMGEAFVPADQLAHIAPYKSVTSAPAPWNVLRFDGITQFYSWRLEVARQWSQGHFPVWNSYQFAASGGTPLLANSQSAPLYPLNILFLLCYKAGIFWYAFGLCAALHLSIAATGTYRFLRALSLVRPAALLGAIAFTVSGPVITWLSLPTFLAVSCWIPWLLLLIRRAHEQAGTPSGLRTGAIAAMVAGIMLLAGHLQMAFYGLLAGGLYLLWEGHFAVQLRKQTTMIKWAGSVVLAGVILISLALPQVLPALELSRISHRATSGPPTMESYAAFTASALPLRNLVTFLIPDFFGHPNNNDGFYWNNNNYGEWCLYVGIAPLFLAVFGLALPWRGNALPPERGFFAGLCLLSLLMAMGTPINLPFFFLVPGFSQLGNPGRILVVTTFTLAVLAAFGLQGLLDTSIPKHLKGRASGITIAVLLLVASVGASLSVPFAKETVPSVPFGQLMVLALPSVAQAIIGLILTVLLLISIQRPNTQNRPILGALLALTILDLGIWGYNYNPTRPAKDVYPITPGIAWLQQNGKEALIAPLNRRWSIVAQSPPKEAMLPPNGLTVYQLHDISGYDSLFRGISKEQIKTAASGEDPSPPENGNMVFIKSVDTALQLRAKYIVVPPEAPDLSAAGIIQVYTGADMTIYENPNGTNFDGSGENRPLPLSVWIGLGAGIFGMVLLLGTLFITRVSK